jgi:amino-acid N-acetyltransferase
MIEIATEGDLPSVRALLERVHLPVDGVDDHVETLLVAREGSQIVGSAAVELYGDGALLRSVAVAPHRQGRRVGHQLTDAALQLARIHGARTAFLLTTTAERFFPRWGFEEVGRDEVPVPMRESVEFRFACPESAIVMRCHLSARGDSLCVEK